MVLTFANFMTRLIGFIYRIQLSRMIGAQGIGLFQLVMPVHMLTITLVTAGLPVAVSRMVSQRTALGDSRGAKKVIRVGLAAVSLFSIIVMALMLASMKFIALVLLKEPRTYLSLLIFTPCILILGLSAIYNGYFYGKKNFHPPALSELVEQIIRVVLVLGTLYLLPPLKAEHAAAIAMLGMVIGELMGLVLVQYIYMKEKRMEPARPTSLTSTGILHEMWIIALPITGTRVVSSVMQMVNSILIPQRLVVSGLSQSEALAQFGMLTGMAMPFIFLPHTLTSALSVVMIPNLTEHSTLRDWVSIQDKVAKASLITGLTSFPIAAIMMPLSSSLGTALYGEPQVGILLYSLSPLIIPVCFQHLFSATLNGLGKQGVSARNYLIGAVALLLCTYFLVADPRIGIHGYIIGSYLSSLITCVLNLLALMRYGRVKPDPLNWFVKPFFASLCMGATILWSFEQLSGYSLPMSVQLSIPIVLGLGVFLTILMSMGILTKDFIHEFLQKTRSVPK